MSIDLYRALAAFFLTVMCTSRLSADYVAYDPSVGEAASYLRAWSFGTLEASAAVGHLREFVENPGESGEGRAFALRSLAWIDIYSEELDLRDLVGQQG